MSHLLAVGAVPQVLTTTSCSPRPPLKCPLPPSKVQLKGDEEQSVFVSPVGADSVKRGYLYAKDFDDLVRCVEVWKY